MNDVINFMGYMWILVEDGLVTIGINDDGIDDLTEPLKIMLPDMDETVEAEQVCGEIESEGGQMDLYSPVSGTIVEINEAVIENPELLFDDCFGEGWLFKIEADNLEDLNVISMGSDDDDDEEEEDDDEPQFDPNEP